MLREVRQWLIPMRSLSLERWNIKVTLLEAKQTFQSLSQKSGHMLKPKGDYFEGDPKITPEE